MSVKHFNVRVYGIMINEHSQVLVCDELIKKHAVTKFPGGGLEYGEGTIDCIRREFMEETNHEIEVIEHFYTTDFFQASAYNPVHQIISIYYMVKPKGNFDIKTTEKLFDFTNAENYDQTFRWVNLSEITEEHFTLPIDKVIGRMLQEKYA